MSVNDSTTNDSIPTSEVSISSSNKRKALNDILTVSSHSSKVKTPPVDNGIVPVYQIFQLVMPNQLNLPNDIKKWNRPHLKSTVLCNERSNGRKDVIREKLCIEKRNGHLPMIIKTQS